MTHTHKQTPILSFNSVEEYNTTLTKVLEMTAEERLAWEKQQGFTSFVTKSNEVYEKVAEKELALKQLQQEIEPLSEYIKLEQEESGDYVLLHALESTPKRFLCNVNRIFKIENTLYKVFEDNIVMCNEKHYKTLLSLNETNYNEVIGEDFQLIFTGNELKDEAYYVPLSYIYTFNNTDRYLLERRNDKGSNRTRLRVGIEFVKNELYYPSIWAEAKPYKRVLGIWYVTNRTVSCEFNIIYDYKDKYGNWCRSTNLRYLNNGTRTSEIYKILKSFDGVKALSDFWVKTHIAATKCWAKTPDTNKAEINHNTQLFNEFY